MTATTRATTRKLAPITLALTLVTTGLLTVAGSTSAVATPISTAKVKCVNTATGFARYSSTGSCRKNERRDRRTCARGGACVVGDIGLAVAGCSTPRPGRSHGGATSRLLRRHGTRPRGTPTWPGARRSRPPFREPRLRRSAPVRRTPRRCWRSAPPARPRPAHGYHGGGKSDWYLPARDELRQLFVHQGKVGEFVFHGYWSSSESDPTLAWIQDFYSDYEPAPSDKSFASYVRPVRAFGPL